ncbi:hypothetical protein J4711_13035 [Staphylococcus epidermidis]|nr:hypothetical protein [Staphylococcus epidermidis]
MFSKEKVSTSLPVKNGIVNVLIAPKDAIKIEIENKVFGILIVFNINTSKLFCILIL